MSSRVIAQRIKTGEFLSWDVPLSEATSTRELSGPGGLTGTINPNWVLLDDKGDPIIEEWATALYHEVDGHIRGGGIVTRLGEDNAGRLTVEAPGFCSYPHGIPYLDEYAPGLGVGPLDVVREIWRHVQSYPDGDLGLVVGDATSAVVLDEVSYDENGAETERKPYTLNPWDNRDCGSEIDSMLRLAPAEYVERHTWNADHTAIEHHLQLGVPVVGRRRSDLRFVEGENIVEAVPVLTDGDDFAQNVVGLGQGEGRDMLRHQVTSTDDKLRRVATVVDKSATAQKLAELTEREQRRRLNVTRAQRVLIRDHPNARIAAISPGDYVLIEAELRWYGRLRGWLRVLSIEENLDEETAVLNVSS